MKLSSAIFVLPCVIAVSCGAATASTSASGNVSNLALTLTNLDPNSSAPNSITFSTGAVDSVSSYQLVFTPFSNSSNTSTTLPFSGEAQNYVVNPDAYASASVSGDASQGTRSENTSATAIISEDGYSFGSGGVATRNASGSVPLSFTLSPNTKLELSGTVKLSADSDCNCAEYAETVLNLSISGTFASTTQTSSFSDFIKASNGEGEQTETRNFDVAFTNASSQSVVGGLTFYMFSDAYTTATPVPEPSSTALLVVGAVFATLARRKRLH